VSIFPDLETLKTDFRAMLTTVEPRYTNVRNGDLGIGVGDALLATVYEDGMANAETLGRSTLLAALARIGQTPKAGQAATVTLTFTRQSGYTPAITVPAGSEWATADRKLIFTLNAAVSLGVGVNTATGLATCTTLGDTGNVAASSITVNASSVPYIQSVSNVDRAQGGENPETDEEFLARAATEFAQHDMLVKTQDFEEAAKAVAGVLKANCLPITRFTAPSTFTTEPGCVTVLALPNDGGTLTSTLKQQIYDALVVKTFVDIERRVTLFVTDYLRQSVAVAYTVVPKAGITGAVCIAECNAALNAALAPAAWTPGRPVSPWEIGAVLEALPSVDRITALTLNSGSSVIALSAWQVTEAGTMTGTAA
jgi:hypothetical protein